MPDESSVFEVKAALLSATRISGPDLRNAVDGFSDVSWAWTAHRNSHTANKGVQPRVLWFARVVVNRRLSVGRRLVGE